MTIETKNLFIYKRIFILGFFFEIIILKNSFDYPEFTVEKLISYSIGAYIYIIILFLYICTRFILI